MIAGRMRHRDSAGHEGLLQDGGVQWMTAGRGVIHSELPEQEDGRMEGFQLWLNLPASDKMTEPWYRDIQARGGADFTTPGGVTVRRDRRIEPRRRRCRSACGHGAGLPRPRAAGGGPVRAAPPAGTTRSSTSIAAACVSGTGGAGAAEWRSRQRRGGRRRRHRGRRTGARCCSSQGGRPTSPRYGPFVMNTNEQIFQAVEDSAPDGWPEQPALLAAKKS